MNYNEFKDYVKEHVLDYLPEQYKYGYSPSG